MTTLHIVVTATETPTPAGQTYASTQVTVTDSAGAIQTSALGADGTLDVVVTAVGDGTVVAQAIDTAGNPLGAPQSGAFTIPPVSMFPQPASITVTLV